MGDFLRLGKVLKSFGQLSLQSIPGNRANRILISPKQFSVKKQKNIMVRNSLLIGILEKALDVFSTNFTSLQELSLLQNFTVSRHQKLNKLLMEVRTRLLYLLS